MKYLFFSRDEFILAEYLKLAGYRTSSTFDTLNL